MASRRRESIPGTEYDSSTNGWVLATTVEKEAVASVDFSGHESANGSLTSRLLGPLLDSIASWVPPSVAPNVISTCSVLCLVQAWFFCYHHIAEWPKVCSGVAGALIIGWWVLDMLGSRHARRISNQSAVTELFDHACSSTGWLFGTMTFCMCMGIDRIDAQWSLVQATQLLVLHKQLGALRSGQVRYRLLNGPGEAVFFVLCVLAIRAYVGLGAIEEYFNSLLDAATALELDYLQPLRASEIDLKAASPFHVLFLLVLGMVVWRCWSLPEEFYATRNGVLLCLLFRPTLSYLTLKPTTLIDVFAAGTHINLIMADVVVSRMAGRDLHPWLVLMAFLSSFHNLASILLLSFYYGSAFYEICSYCKLPLLLTNTNVYCDGIFDVCHIGHMKAFKQAARFGTRLFVGVCSDEDATPYKRAPIMTMEERMEVVAACKHVYQVIPHAPCAAGDLTEAFLNKYNIHVVAHGAEYDKPDDKYYAVPRQKGMVRCTGRTEGMSTSDLIKRIQSRGANGQEVKAASS